MLRLFRHLQKLPLVYKTFLGYCIFCFIYVIFRFCYEKRRNRTATSAGSVELQQVAPAVLNSRTSSDGDVELPQVPPKVEAVAYRSDKITKINCEDCAICLGSLEKGDEYWVLKSCNHTYHKKCIEEWLCQSSNCPLCRGAIRA